MVSFQTASGSWWRFALRASKRIRINPPRHLSGLFLDLAQTTITYAFFLSAHLAFIIADNFFRMAALIGRRPVDFLTCDAAFLGADLPFCFAHHAFFAAAILARAAELMRRRFWPLAGLACLTLGGRPRRAGWEPSPTRAAIAYSIRSISCLSCVTTLLMSMCILSLSAISRREFKRSMVSLCFQFIRRQFPAKKIPHHSHPVGPVCPPFSNEIFVVPREGSVNPQNLPISDIHDMVARTVKIFDRFEKARLAASTNLFALPSPPPR